MRGVKFSLSGRMMAIIAGVLVVLFSCFCLMLAAAGALLSDQRRAQTSESPTSAALADPAPTAAQQLEQETAAPTAEPTAGVVATAKPAPTSNQVPTRTPEPTAEPVQTIAQQVEQYASDVGPTLETFTQGLGLLGVLLSSPDLLSPSWQASVVTAATFITTAYDDLRKVVAPPALEEVHFQLIDAWSHCDVSATLLIRSIDELNGGQIDTAQRSLMMANREIDTCTQKIDKATKSLQRVVP